MLFKCWLNFSWEDLRRLGTTKESKNRANNDSDCGQRDTTTKFALCPIGFGVRTRTGTSLFLIQNEDMNKRTNNNSQEDHFAHLGKMVTLGSDARRKISDYRLSHRPSCSLPLFGMPCLTQDLREESVPSLTKDGNRSFKPFSLAGENGHLRLWHPPRAATLSAPRSLAAYGAPRRHSRACSGIQRNKGHHTNRKSTSKVPRNDTYPPLTSQKRQFLRNKGTFSSLSSQKR